MRARLIDAIDGSFIPTDDSNETPQEVIERRIREIDARVDSLADAIPERQARLNLALRLWAGGIDAAKMLRIDFVTGPGTTERIAPETRAEAFSQSIDLRAADDAIYRAGVEAAPALQRLRDKEPAFEGVPPESAVRRYA